jgi:hypothetical protein
MWGSEWNSDESEGDSRSSREIEYAAACLRGGPNGQCRGDVAHASSNVIAQGTEGLSRGDVSLVNLGDNDGPSANASRASGGDASGLQDDDSSGDKTDEENLPLPGRCGSCNSYGNLGRSCTTCGEAGILYSEEPLPGDQLTFVRNCPTCGSPGWFGHECQSCEDFRMLFGYPFDERWK